MNATPIVGVAVVGHGTTASRLLAAVRGIIPGVRLEGVVAMDAGEGETPDFGQRMCDVIAQLDSGRGVVLLVDLLGASPHQCAQREGVGHDLVVLSGLNLAMLLKLAALDRRALDAGEIAEACADSAVRSVKVTLGTRPQQTDTQTDKGGDA
jgi:PTS system mannose-specific IIA component